jgi:hypothetical protein
MTEHPALRMARTAADAAGELRGYTDPADPFPWELTEDDHRAILPRLDHAISAFGDCIKGIAQATGDEYAQRQLTGSYHRLVQASAGVRLAVSSLDDGPDEAAGQPGEELGTAAHPARVSASDFPAVMTGDVLRAASSPAVQPSGPAVTASPERAQAPSRQQPGSPRTR